MKVALAPIAAALVLTGCERSYDLASLSEECAGVKVVIARNSSDRAVELYARRDTSAAALIGVVPPLRSGEYPLPPEATGVFIFSLPGPTDSMPLTFRYRCDAGAPRPAAPGATS